MIDQNLPYRFLRGQPLKPPGSNKSSTESGNKNCRKTTSALEPQNTGQTIPGRENFSEIKPLILVHARQS